jgi:hypothetical protein
MLDRTQRADLKPKRLAADTAYGTSKFLGWLVGENLTHIPVWASARSRLRAQLRRKEAGKLPQQRLLRTTAAVLARRHCICSAAPACESGEVLHHGCAQDPRDLMRRRDVARRKMKTRCSPDREMRESGSRCASRISGHHGFEHAAQSLPAHDGHLPPSCRTSRRCAPD